MLLAIYWIYIWIPHISKYVYDMTFLKFRNTNKSKAYQRFPPCNKYLLCVVMMFSAWQNFINILLHIKHSIAY